MTMNVSVRRAESRPGTFGTEHQDPLGNMGQMELFSEFYRSMTGRDLSEYQTEILRECIETGGDSE